ncbi:unnamed protein product [Anisakis simplex]|uniref:Clathrin light chain n=1 Tax=Anisakis simplex TaxID=6269 RepID=A0A0M3J7F2_ANISI|nr:unnamed protein product [Anisakis simplex]
MEYYESTVIDQGKEGFTSDGWAAFESAPSGSVVESKEDESDEWAADFSSAPYAPPSMQSASKQSQINENFGEYDEASLPSLCNIYKADRVKEWVVDNVQWQDEKGNEIEEDATSENDCCKNEFENVLEDLQETRHAVDSLKAWQSLWLAIGVVEEALALKMQWSHSSFYSSFLDSLNLDANLVSSFINSFIFVDSRV